MGSLSDSIALLAIGVALLIAAMQQAGWKNGFVIWGTTAAGAICVLFVVFPLLIDGIGQVLEYLVPSEPTKGGGKADLLTVITAATSTFFGVIAYAVSRHPSIAVNIVLTTVTLPFFGLLVFSVFDPSAFAILQESDRTLVGLAGLIGITYVLRDVLEVAANHLGHKLSARLEEAQDRTSD